MIYIISAIIALTCVAITWFLMSLKNRENIANMKSLYEPKLAVLDERLQTTIKLAETKDTIINSQKEQIDDFTN